MTQYLIHRDDELRHHGVKGSKWGVRRYQNEDGSYKPGAEGRYYQPVNGKKTISGTTKNVSTQGGGYSVKVSPSTKAARELHKTRGSVIEEGQHKKSSVPSKATPETEKTPGGGGGAVEEKKDEKEITTKLANGKEIQIHDVSEKKVKEEKGSKGGGSSSSKNKTDEEKEKEKAASDFKLSSLTDKIDNFFGEMSDEDWEDMELSDSDMDEVDDLITKYRAWREKNTSKTKQTKKIDAFIERYQAWRSNHGKKASHSAIHEEYLEHFGILGMKWGIRRYQNPDGSYTEAGKRRKSKGKDYSEDYWNAHDKKKVEYMSDKELQKRNNRLQQEQQYKALTKTKADKTKEAIVKGGKKLLAATVGATIMTMAVKYTRNNLPDVIRTGSDFISNSVAMSMTMNDLIKKNSHWLL